MKNLFSYDRTGKETAAFVDDNPFVTARLSDDLQAQMDTMNERLNAILDGNSSDKGSEKGEDGSGDKRSFLVRHWPMWLSILLAAAAFFLIQLAFRDENSTTWMLVAGIALLVCAWFLISRETKNLRKGSIHIPPPDMEAYSKDMDRLAGETRRELHIPENAIELEVLPYVYARKKDTIKSCYPAHTYDNMLLYAWSTGDGLCLSEGHTVLTIPKTAIMGYHCCDESYTVEMWLKEEKCNGGRYKQYHIRQTGLLSCRVKGYNRVLLRSYNAEDNREDNWKDNREDIREEHNGVYELLIPCYDWPELEKLLHINKID